MSFRSRAESTTRKKHLSAFCPFALLVLHLNLGGHSARLVLDPIPPSARWKCRLSIIQHRCSDHDRHDATQLETDMYTHAVCSLLYTHSRAPSRHFITLLPFSAMTPMLPTLPTSIDRWTPPAPPFSLYRRPRNPRRMGAEALVVCSRVTEAGVSKYKETYAGALALDLTVVNGSLDTAEVLRQVAGNIR